MLHMPMDFEGFLEDYKVDTIPFTVSQLAQTLFGLIDITNMKDADSLSDIDKLEDLKSNMHSCGRGNNRYIFFSP
jgi:hypothetical protein